MRSLLLRRVRLVPVTSARSHRPAALAGDRPVDVRLAGEHVVDVAPRLAARPQEAVLDGEGRWLIPGLWDQHVHSRQWAQSFARLDLGSATSAAQVAELVHGAVVGAPRDELFEGYGFRDALWPDLPTTTALDQASPDVPIVLVSGDVHCGWLNTAAWRFLGLRPAPGPVREHEWFDLLARIGRLSGPTDAGYDRAMAAAAARGVVGVVDLEFAANHRDWPRRVADGLDRLRVRTGVYVDDLDDVISAGLRSGQPLPGGGGLLTMGPLKVISDGALNTRTASCHEPYAVPAAPGHHAGAVEPDRGEQTVLPEELDHLMRRATAAGLSTAVHAIGDAAVTVALDAYASSGARGSIEHAQLVRPADLPRFAELGVIASVQPAHLLDDRDVADSYWPGRADRAFPLRGLLDAGARLAFGSDTPVAPFDPWLAMATAVYRSGDRRPAWTPAQQVTAAEALAASTDGWGTVAPGHPSDVVLLEADPLAPSDDPASAADRLRQMPVAATIVASRLTHHPTIRDS